MKKLLLALAALTTLTGCSHPATSISTAESLEIHTEDKSDEKQAYTKVHIFNGSLGGTCVRIKDWEIVRSAYGDIYGIKVWFSDESPYKGEGAFLPQGIYMLLTGECPLCY
jgi:ABC-type glycerol-3-phosphate transport system substrate-binding protein